MGTNFTRKYLAVDSAPAYSEQVKDDVYVVRSARGDEWRLVTRKEMLEFKSCYIEHYQRYSPKERVLATLLKFLQNNGIVCGKMETEGKTITIKTEEKTYKLELYEADKN